jgi:hypothetical protein
MGTLRTLRRRLDPYRQALALAKEAKIKEIIDNKMKEDGWKSLPIDPLLEQKAPENNYPENQGMGNAFKEYQ